MTETPAAQQPLVLDSDADAKDWPHLHTVAAAPKRQSGRSPADPDDTADDDLDGDADPDDGSDGETDAEPGTEFETDTEPNFGDGENEVDEDELIAT